MKIFHHCDHDGRCAAYLLKYYLDMNSEFISKSDFIETDYNTVIDRSIFSIDERVYFLDYHPKVEEDYIWLRKNTQLFIFDHHRSAIEDITRWESENEFINPIYRILDESRSGCKIVYDELLSKRYFFYEPYFVTLINDYDTWSHNYQDTFPFFYGLQLLDTNPFSKIWDQFIDDKDQEHTKVIIDSGRIIYQYQINYDMNELRNIGFEIEFEGYQCLCINRWRSSSNTFSSYPDYKIYISFYYDGSKWTVGLYSRSKDTDVSVIAKKYGGGGHPGSAGFQCKTLPFIVG